jgi:hypothetical protein
MSLARSFPVALLALLALAPRVHAQTIETTTTTQVDAVVEARVTTTTTTVTRAEPAVVAAPIAASPGTGAPSALVGFLLPRLEILTLDATYDMAALGGSVLVGADVGDGWSGGLLLAYFGELGFDGPVSELDIGLEATRDLFPDETLGFLLTARVAAAVPLGALDRGQSPVHFVAQLGLGARVALDSRIAILFDLRAHLRARPDDSVAAQGGLVTTMGLRIDLD